MFKFIPPLPTPSESTSPARGEVKETSTKTTSILVRVTRRGKSFTSPLAGEVWTAEQFRERGGITIKFFLIFITAFILLTSCGFHLRGHVSIPPELKTLFLQSNTPYGDFEQTLRTRLRSYNIKLTDTAADAPLTLAILSTNCQQTHGAFSTNLTTRQFTLSLTITYQVLSSTGTVVIPTNSVTSTTAFTIDSSQLLSSTDLGQQYHDNLQQDAASRLMSQLVSNNNRHAIDAYFAQAKIDVGQTSAP